MYIYIFLDSLKQTKALSFKNVIETIIYNNCRVLNSNNSVFKCNITMTV